MKATLTKKGVLNIHHIFPNGDIFLSNQRPLTVWRDGTEHYYLVDISNCSKKQIRLLAEYLAGDTNQPIEVCEENIKKWGECPVSCKYISRME